MSARHRLPRAPRTDGDGVFAGIVLVAANLFGLGIITAGQAPHSASAAVALDAPPAEDTPDAGPFTAKKDSGPVAPPALPRAAQPACHDAGCPTVPSRPTASTSLTLLPLTSRDLALPTVPLTRSRMSRVMS